MTTINSTTAAQSLLFAHFETIAETPGGIARLRRLILQLAMQGRLVEQDPSDEPAKILVEQIRGEKEQLLRTRAIQRLKTEFANESDVLSYIPDSWVWLKCGEIGAPIDHAIVDGPFGSNLLLSDYDENGSYPVVTISNFDQGFELSKLRKVNDKKYNELRRSTIRPGDILMAKIGSSYGKVGIYPEHMPIGIIPANMLKITVNSNLSKEYLLYFLKSALFRSQLETIVKVTAQPAFSVTAFKELLLPLPPLAEQRRIVERVDALMALCDALDERQARRGEERQRLLSALVDALLSARDAGEAAAAWARLSESFDLVLAAPEDVAPLRQAVLQLAVQGRLVEQDEGDEPASSYLEHLTPLAEPLPRISQQDQPYKLCDGWTWLRLGQFIDFVGGSQPPKSQFIYEPRDGYTRFIQIRDFKTEEHKTYIPNHLANRPFTEDDVMIGRYGPPVFQILRGLRGTYNVALMKAIPNPKITSKDYIFYLLQEPRIQAMVVRESERTAGQSGVRKELLNAIVAGIPPLAEQRRIVARVEQLMVLCGALEARLREERAAAERLAEALCAAVAGTAMGSEAAPAAQDEVPVMGEAGTTPVELRSHAPGSPIARFPHSSEVEEVRAKAPAATRGNGHANGAAHENDAYQTAAVLLAERGTLTNGELQAALGLDGAAARALLKGLVAAGLARQEGERRGTRYVWIGQHRETVSQMSLNRISQE